MQLVGDVTLLSECGVATAIAVRVSFPVDYPQSEPTAYDNAKRFPEDVDRHILPGGRFCLWLPPYSPWNPDDPQHLLRFLDEVAVFLDRQLVFEATGCREWPGPQQRHGRAGYEDYMLEFLGGTSKTFQALLPTILNCTPLGRNDPCACGSGRKFKRCHAESVEEIVREIGRPHLAYMYKLAPRNSAPENPTTT